MSKYMYAQYNMSVTRKYINGNKQLLIIHGVKQNPVLLPILQDMS